jgi:hypothetical protein
VDQQTVNLQCAKKYDVDIYMIIVSIILSKVYVNANSIYK